MKKYLSLLALVAVVAFSATTANMGLVKPATDGSESNYVGKIDTILNVIDAHDHTTGKGVQIPSGGIADGAITTSKIANQSVTIAKRAAVTVGTSVGAGGLAMAATIASATSVGATETSLGQTITLVTTGRPVEIGLQGATGSVCALSGASECEIRFSQTGTDSATYRAAYGTYEACNAARVVIAPISAGTYSYTAVVDRVGVSGNCAATNVKLYGVER